MYLNSDINSTICGQHRESFSWGQVHKPRIIRLVFNVDRNGKAVGSASDQSDCEGFKKRCCSGWDW
jgi:hypothetical protein